MPWFRCAACRRYVAGWEGKYQHHYDGKQLFRTCAASGQPIPEGTRTQPSGSDEKKRREVE